MVIFHVLRCAQCETFQVLQVTKSRKWKCKLCGQKQSVIKVYGEGTGAECRRHVQKLNTLRGEADQALEEKHFSAPFLDEPASNLSSVHHPSYVNESTLSAEPVSGPSSLSHRNHVVPKAKSRWSSYLDDRNDNEEEELIAEATGPDAGLWGHVTTDWSEYSKRRREVQGGSHKRKISHQTHNSAAGETSLKETIDRSKILRMVTPYSTQSTTQDTLSQQDLLPSKVNTKTPVYTESIRYVGGNAQEANVSLKPISQNTFSQHNVLPNNFSDSTPAVREGSRNIDRVKEANKPMSFHPDSRSSCTTVPSFNATLRERKFDSVRKTAQQKPQSGLQSTSSKWAMFLNENESDEEEEDSDGFENQILLGGTV